MQQARATASKTRFLSRRLLQRVSGYSLVRSLLHRSDARLADANVSSFYTAGLIPKLSERQSRWKTGQYASSKRYRALSQAGMVVAR
jgi:hypothetical protein